jgi:hypothetical protein
MLETVSLKRIESIIASSWIQGSQFDSGDVIATRGMMADLHKQQIPPLRCGMTTNGVAVRDK